MAMRTHFHPSFSRQFPVLVVLLTSLISDLSQLLIKNMLAALLVNILFIYSVHNAKILLASMPQGRSHTGSFMPLINKMKEQGHEISLYMEAYPNETNFGLTDRMLKITGKFCLFGS